VLDAHRIESTGVEQCTPLRLVLLAPAAEREQKQVEPLRAVWLVPGYKEAVERFRVGAALACDVRDRSRIAGASAMPRSAAIAGARVPSAPRMRFHSRSSGEISLKRGRR
jgi:hypothetical protein